MNTDITFYKNLLLDIKNRVRQGQIKAYVSANAEMLATYWDIGKMIHERQQSEGWGKGVIPRLAVDLKNELAESKGFSERNLKMMVQFYNEYNHINSIGQPPVAQLEIKPNTQSIVSKIDENSIVQLPVAQLENDTNSISPMALAKLENFDNQLFISVNCLNLDFLDLHDSKDYKGAKNQGNHFNPLMKVQTNETSRNNI
jgi:predicted nuclease of restriction endonuclease-like (RecB) superfamily